MADREKTLRDSARASGNFLRSGNGNLALLVRIAIVLIATIAVWLVVIEGLGPFFGPAYSDRVGHATRAVLISALAIPLVLLAWRYLDRRPWEELRLTSLRVGLGPMLFGAVFWLVFAGIGMLVSLYFGLASISFGEPSADLLFLMLYLPALVFLYEALPEELIFREYFYRNFSERFSRWMAVVGQAFLFTLFGAAIGAAGSVDRIILFFTFSLTLGILRVITDNLWASIGFHLAFQYVTQFIAAATRDGFITIEGFGNLQIVAFWLLPIVLGGFVLFVGSMLRGDTRWRRREMEEIAY